MSRIHRDWLRRKADELGITVSELLRRLISAEMQKEKGVEEWRIETK